MLAFSMAVAAGEDTQHHELNVYRDTIESIWVAIVLAFVLRAFMIEAFVIPTGSMAPRLLGEHWDLVCPACGYEFAYGGASSATDSGRLSHAQKTPPENARCPNCGTPYPAAEQPDFLNSGDRVLVMKYLYNFLDPQPWDVVVFKNPQDNRQNYIKRLIGLPGETIEIVHGDIFVSAGPDPNLRSIRHKPPQAQEAMWQVVYDNDYPPDPGFPGRGDTPRWRPADESHLWDLDANGGRCFRYQGGKDSTGIFLQADSEVFYPHYGYNGWQRDRERFNRDIDVCSDLRLSAVLFPQGGSDVSVRLGLSSFEFRFEAEITSDGVVSLLCRGPGLPEDAKPLQTKVAALQPGKGYRIALTHVDFRAEVWVEGQRVLATTEQEYPGPKAKGCYQWLLQRLEHVPAQRIPPPEVRMAARGGACELRHVALHRDVYYTPHRLDPIPEGPSGDYARDINRARSDARDKRLAPGDIRHRAVQPGGRGWGTTGCPVQLAKNPQDPDLDEFFCLGDNSPQSLDGRGWIQAADSLRLYTPDGHFLYQLGTVPRYNLLGKALFVYWPGGYRLPFLRSLPIVPNVGKMRFVR